MNKMKITEIEKKDTKVINFNKTKKSKKKKNRIKAAGVILIFAAVIAFLMSPFFKINNIYVEGNKKVTSESVITKSGIGKDSNLFMINIKKTKSFIKSISYVDDVNIIRNLRKDVIIKITERIPVGYLKNGTGCCLIDCEGRVLEFQDSIPQSIPEITGIKTGNLKQGDYIDEKYNDNIVAMAELITEFKNLDMFERVSEINVKDSKNLIFMFDGNKKIIMGENYRTDYKLALLKSTIEELAPSEAGTIDLSSMGQALFSPNE